MATVREIIEKAYTKTNGEYEAMVESSDDFRTYLSVLNQVMENWASTPYVKWQTLFNPDYTLPDTVANGVLEYDIPDIDRIVLANSPLDAVYFVNAGSVVEKFKMVDQALFQSSRSKNIVMMVGDKLYLKEVKPEISGTSIQLPVYMMPPKYTSGSEEVRVDSVSWLVSAMAAFVADASPVPFIARNADKFAKEAAIFMKTMRENNRHAQILSIKRVGDKRFTSLSAAIDAGVGVGGGSFDDLDGGAF